MKKRVWRITPVITLIVLMLSILTILFFSDGGITGYTSTRTSGLPCTSNVECLSQNCSYGHCTCETDNDCWEGTCVNLRCVL